MITDVGQFLGDKDQNLGKWIKLTEDETAAVIRSIPGANVMRASAANKHVGLRHYVDRGYIVVHDMGGEAGPHPLGGVGTQQPSTVTVESK